ncbi:MAG: glycosyltransferase family 39 protein, partial [Actinobacteria bacterium]|nr:glycosyltransferase family 39 protein [Actinomycetota bacterium]
MALAERIPAVNAGLPYLFQADEPQNVAVGVSLANHLSVDPHIFHYPSMLYFIIAIVRLLGRAFAGPGTPVVIVSQGTGIDMTTDALLFTELRLIVVAFSVAMCIIVWLTVRWITDNAWAAAFAGFCGALSPLLVFTGIFITPDTLSAFFVAFTLAAALLIYRRGHRFDYVAAGIGVGLSAGAKYNAAAVAIAVIAAHVARYRGGSGRSAGPLVAAGAISVVIFLITTPAAVLHTHEFLTGALGQLSAYGSPHSGVTGSSFWYYLGTLHRDSIIGLVTAPLAVLAIAGRWRIESLIIVVY